MPRWTGLVAHRRSTRSAATRAYLPAAEALENRALLSVAKLLPEINPAIDQFASVAPMLQSLEIPRVEPALGGLRGILERLRHANLFQTGIHARITPFVAQVGVEYNGNVAAFLMVGDLGTVTATIDWGDGTDPTPATITSTRIGDTNMSVGTVSGTHTFTSAGDVTIKVTFHFGENQTTSAAGKGFILPLPVFTVVARDLTAKAGKPITDRPIAAFLTPDQARQAGDFSAMINWGDGTDPTKGSITTIPRLFPDRDPDDGSDINRGEVFVVLGSHTYAQPGTNTITITITGPGDQNGVATATARILSADARPKPIEHPIAINPPAAHPHEPTDSGPASDRADSDPTQLPSKISPPSAAAIIPVSLSNAGSSSLVNTAARKGHHPRGPRRHKHKHRKH